MLICDCSDQCSMAYYILLLKWTEQGIKNIKNSPKRAAAARKEVEKIGGKITFYYTFGKYDIVAVLEAPDDEAAMKLGLSFGALGNVRVTTMKAFSEADAAKVIGKLA
jgi:uncharacterized protein with GYD domain